MAEKNPIHTKLIELGYVANFTFADDEHGTAQYCFTTPEKMTLPLTGYEDALNDAWQHYQAQQELDALRAFVDEVAGVSYRTPVKVDENGNGFYSEHAELKALVEKAKQLKGGRE